MFSDQTDVYLISVPEESVANFEVTIRADVKLLEGYYSDTLFEYSELIEGTVDLAVAYRYKSLFNLLYFTNQINIFTVIVLYCLGPAAAS